jgi:hypothetical protein
VNGRTLKAELATTQRLFTIRNDSLFISDLGQTEIHYNNLSLPQPFRATTHYFTINFIENRFEGRAVVVQELAGDAEVFQVRCAFGARD